MRKLAVLGIFVFAVCAQADDRTWSRRFPGAQSIGGIARAADGYWLTLQRRDGQCLAALDSNGNGRSEQCFDSVATNIVASNGAHFLYGLRIVPGSASHVWVGKFDANNRVIWSRQVPVDQHVILHDAAATSDGGVVLIGGYGEPCRPGCDFQQATGVLKFAADGSLQWFRIMDESGFEAGSTIRESNDGYVIAAVGQNNGVHIARLDRSGAPVWNAWLADAAGTASLDVVSGGDIVVAADAVSGASPTGYVVARFTADGKLQWQKGAPVVNGEIQTLSARPDGTFILRARGVVRNSWAAFLIAFNRSGDVLWQRATLLPNDAVTEAIHVTADGSVLLAIGQNDAPAELHKFSASGGVPTALAPATIVSDLAFTPFSSIPVKASVETAILKTVAVDDPVAARNGTILTEDASSKRPATPQAAAVAIRPDQQKAMAEAQEIQAEEDQLTKEIVQLLASRKFAELERIGREFRDSRACSASGYSKLALFYVAVDTPALEYGGQAEHLRLIDDWLQAYPGSVTAATAAARTYIEYAYAARGVSTSDGVTAEAWKKHEALLERAREILKLAEGFAASDPGYQTARIDVAGASCDGLNAIVHDPQFARLDDWTMWRAGANFLLPRWCGSPEEYRRFAEYAAASTRATDGEALYALIAYDAVRIENDRSVVASYKFDWPRIRQGFFDIIKRFPRAPFGYHRLAFMAWFFDDRQTAKSMFDKPIVIWSSFAQQAWPNQGAFEQARTWAGQSAQRFVTSNEPKSRPASASALRKPPESSTSWMAAGVANWPALLLINDIRLQDGTSDKSHSFLVQTRSGVVAVSALTNFGKRWQRPAIANLPAAEEVRPVPLDSFRAKLATWTMSAPSKTSQKFTVARIDPKTHDNTHGVVLTLAATRGPLPVKVLAPRDLNAPRAAGRLFVVACRPQATPCVQSAFPGTVSGGGGSPEELKISLVLDDPVDWTDIVGAPVIDQDGLLVGVASGPSSSFNSQDKPGTVRIDVEEINSLLAHAGV